MVINEWVIASMALVAAIIGGALLRQRRTPAVQTPTELRWELEDLRREVSKLREETMRQRATIETLQDLLTDRQAEITRLNARVWQLEHPQPDALPVAEVKPAYPDNLLAVLGSDPALEVDLAVLRAAEVAQRFRLIPLRSASKRRLANTLQRYRSRGEPLRFVHFATHGSEEGIALADGAADGVWLSESLAGVELCLITGCSTATAAHLARVVPVVVSMSWDVGMADAMEFAGVFWGQIARGVTPRAAFYTAVQRAPAAGEVAELHEDAG